MKIPFRSTNKEPQTRRHPTGGTSTRQSFSYYSSQRRSPESSNQTGARQVAADQKSNSAFAGYLSFVGKRFGSIAIGLVLFASAISLLQVDTTPRVVLLNDSSKYRVNSEATYAESVADSIRGSFLNSNKVTINTTDIVQDLKLKYPEVYDASIVLPLVGHKPTLYVELARPALLVMTPRQTSVVDVSGRALSVAEGNVRAEGLPSVIDESQLEIELGKVVFSSSSVSFIEEVVRQFGAKNIIIDKMILPAGKEELDVYPKNKKYHVKFNLHETNVREQLGTYFAVKKQLVKKGTTPKQYIDVRLAGRAYYQ